VQEHALESVFAHFFVEFRITVFRVTRHGVTRIGCVHANLMRSPRQDRHFEQ
jgi:hypothetical protein